MMKKLLSFLVVLLVAGAYLYGRWPERQRRLALEGEKEILQRRIEQAETRVRLCALLGQLQNVMHAVSLNNYGQARELSSRFFDDARTESNRSPDPAYKQSLEAALGRRDAVTAALAQADPTALESLRQVEARLKGVLGHPWPAASPVEPLAPTPAPIPEAPRSPEASR